MITSNVLNHLMIDAADPRDISYWVSINFRQQVADEFRELAKSKGYVPGTKIYDESGTLLRIGYGFVYSELQEAVVCGCSSKEGYHSSVPIYYPKQDKWAELYKEV